MEEAIGKFMEGLEGRAWRERNALDLARFTGYYDVFLTTLCQLCSIATLRSCDVLILSTAEGSHWSPLQGWKQFGKDCQTDLPLWWLTPQ
jgi:hypothetical protein